MSEYKNYNTFRFFDDYENKQKQESDDFVMPEMESHKNYFWRLLILFILAGLIGFGFHPVLSYSLKTPYPLVVINEDRLEPTLYRDDLIIVEGVVSMDNIKQNDIVVYNSKFNTSELLVRRVNSCDNMEIVVSNVSDGFEERVEYTRVVGKAVGDERPIRLKWVGGFLKLVSYHVKSAFIKNYYFWLNFI